MGQIEKQFKGKVVFKHETEAVWHTSNNGGPVEYVPAAGEKVLYDRDDNHDYTRIKYGDGTHIVAELPFSTEQSDWSQTDTEAIDYIKNKPNIRQYTDNFQFSATNSHLNVADDIGMGWMIEPNAGQISLSAGDGIAHIDVGTNDGDIEMHTQFGEVKLTNMGDLYVNGPIHVEKEIYGDLTGNVTTSLVKSNNNGMAKLEFDDEEVKAKLTTGSAELTLKDSVKLSHTQMLEGELVENSITINGEGVDIDAPKVFIDGMDIILLVGEDGQIVAIPDEDGNCDLLLLGNDGNLPGSVEMYARDRIDLQSNGDIQLTAPDERATLEIASGETLNLKANYQVDIHSEIPKGRVRITSAGDIELEADDSTSIHTKDELSLRGDIGIQLTTGGKFCFTENTPTAKKAVDIAVDDFIAMLDMAHLPLVMGEGENSIVQTGTNEDPSAHNLGVNDSIGKFSVTFGDSNLNQGQSSLIAGSCNHALPGGGFSIMAGTWNVNKNFNSLIVGHNNENLARATLIGGYGNHNIGENAIVGGFSNRVLERSSNSGVLGRENTLNGRDSLVIGASNLVGNSETGSIVTMGCAFVGGFENSVTGAAGITAGTDSLNNHLYSIICGDGLVTCGDHQAIFGQYNAAVDNANFIVGCGSASGGRKNAFEILDTGSTVVRGNLYVKGDFKDNIKATAGITTSGETRFQGDVWFGIADQFVHDTESWTFNSNILFKNNVEFQGSVKGLVLDTLANRVRGSQIILNDGTEGAVRGHALMIGNNSTYVKKSILLGDDNYVNGYSSDADNVAVIGVGNSLSGMDNLNNILVVGSNNGINTKGATNTCLLGTGLLSYNDGSCVIVGRYNKAVDNARFVVGTGTASDWRENGLVVKEGGQLIVDQDVSLTGVQTVTLSADGKHKLKVDWNGFTFISRETHESGPEILREVTFTAEKLEKIIKFIDSIEEDGL